MEFNELYRAVIALYRDNNSIQVTSELLRISTVKTRRILITEGLWSSKTSIKVGALYKEGFSAEEIAEKLSMSLKNVQAYIPYSRGTYGEEITGDSQRSSLYRSRKKSLAGAAAMPNIEKESFDAYTADESLRIHAEESAQLELGKAIPYMPKEDAALILKLELVEASDKGDYLPLRQIDPQDYVDLLFYGKAEEGISRTVVVPGDLTLHSLHFLIQKAFGLLNGHLHSFSLLESRFKALTGGTYSSWEKYCGALFVAPADEMPADALYDDDFDGRFSIKQWLQSKYQSSLPYFCASEAFITQRKLAEEKKEFFEKAFQPAGPFCHLLERLTISEILRPMNPMSQNDFASMINGNICHASDNLGKLSSQEKKLLEVYLIKYREACEELQKLKKVFGAIGENHPKRSLLLEYEQRLAELRMQLWPAIESLNPRLEAFTDKIIYTYDTGDQWQILITCIKKIPGKAQRPECIAADGLNLIEDCGGLDGYIRMLIALSGDLGKEETAIAKAHARSLGFTGRKSRPECIL